MSPKEFQSQLKDQLGKVVTAFPIQAISDHIYFATNDNLFAFRVGKNVKSGAFFCAKSVKPLSVDDRFWELLSAADPNEFKKKYPLSYRITGAYCVTPLMFPLPLSVEESETMFEPVLKFVQEFYEQFELANTSDKFLNKANELSPDGMERNWFLKLMIYWDSENYAKVIDEIELLDAKKVPPKFMLTLPNGNFTSFRSILKSQAMHKA